MENRMLFQHPIQAPYSRELKEEVMDHMCPGMTRAQQAARRAEHPEEYLEGPVPDARKIGRLTQRPCNNFAAMRDDLLRNIGGEGVIFSPATIIPPNVTSSYDLYMGQVIWEAGLVIDTKRAMRGEYLKDFLTKNPFLKLFKGLVLTTKGFWNYHETPVIMEQDRSILFIENPKYKWTVAYFGEICMTGWTECYDEAKTYRQMQQKETPTCSSNSPSQDPTMTA